MEHYTTRKPDDYKGFTGCLFSLQTNKSPGHDGISFNVIKNCFGPLSTPLLNIFNLSLEKGIFPDELKIASVTPIYKTGDENDFGNYRPISVLPYFSKMLERIMYKRLYNHLSQNHILYPKQFGFQKSHSTEHAIIQLIDQINSSFEKNNFRELWSKWKQFTLVSKLPQKS